MPRHRLVAPRRADSRVAAIFIILGLGAFSIFGLILAATMLIGVRRAAVTGATKPSPEAARPLSNRYSGLICYCPPDATAVTAIDIAALAADPQAKDISDILAGTWQKVHEKRFGKVPLTIADVEAYVSVTGAGDPLRDAALAPHDRRGTVTALRLKQPVDLQVILRGLDAAGRKVEEQLTRDGTQYFQIYRFVMVRSGDRPERLDDLCFYLSEDRALLVATSRREMEEALQRVPGRLEIRGPLRDVLERADGIAVDALVGTTPLDMGRPGYFASHPQARSVATDGRATAVWFTMRGDEVQYRELLVMPDSDRAASVRDKLVSTFAKRPAQPAGAEADYSRSAHTTAAGERVTIEATIGRTAFAKVLKELVEPAAGKPPPTTKNK